MVERAAKVIATSPTESEELADLVETERLVLRRNGIDLELFRHLPRGGAFRADHGIEEGERIILYLGRISPIKNLEQLVQAFGQADLDRARLVLGGPMLEAGYARRLGALISDLDLANRVSLVGPLYGKAKLSALAAADLFVLPSLFESYGLAAAEAVAAGVPVLLTETCGLAMQIHERAGLAVPVGVSELSRGLQILLEDVEQRARLTCRRDELLVELSWEGPLNQTEELYACLVG
jgi:glycosyltransferase involved in cell wall biosynthesis